MALGLNTAWQYSRLRLLERFGREPDDVQVARFLVADRDALILAGYVDPEQIPSAADVLRQLKAHPAPTGLQ